MSERVRYDAVVASSPQGSIFSTSWWLDAVAGPSWQPNLVEDGELSAAWPTVVQSSRWGPVHMGASLSPFLGPLLPAHDDGKRRWTTAERALELLLDAVEPYAHMEARCHPSFSYWTPLSWRGFSQTTKYTWRLEDLGDLAATEASMRPNIRGDIRKARKQGVSVGVGDLEEFLALHARSTRGRGELAVRTRQVLEQIDAPASERNARRILIAHGKDGEPHAAGYFVWDDTAVYYLAGAADAALRSSGATSLLLWMAIELAAEQGNAFDFEGSMIPSIERFFRAFGGQPVAYSVVRHTPRRGLRAERSLKRAARSALPS